MNEFQPRQRRPYPPHNTPDFEEYFLHTFDKSFVSERIYLPVLWTNYYCNNRHGKALSAFNRLQRYLNRLDRKKNYYTIVQYDDRILHDVSHLDLKVFGLGCKGDYQLPLICQPHPFKFDNERTVFASFSGKRTHKIRDAVFNLKGEDVVISEGLKINEYCELLSKSVFSLCPRGYGATSFRIVESLQYGAIPVYISDEFLIPHGVDFSEYGVLINQGEDILKVLRSIPNDRIEQLQKSDAYNKYMTFEVNRKIVYENI